MIAQELFADKVQQIQLLAAQLGPLVADAIQCGAPIHDVEARIQQVLRGVGLATVQLFVDAMGDGDCGEQHQVPDGALLQRSAEPKSRDYMSIFGPFRFERYVYAAREGQKVLFVEVDARLALPESKFSYLLQDWDQSLAVEQPFGKVVDSIQRILGLRQHVDSLERMNREMARDVEAFHGQQVPPPVAEEGAILVQTADGKGVPIRHAADAPPIQSHQHHMGPKPDRKKMAIVGAVYSVDPFVRTPAQVTEALFAEKPREDQPNRPRPKHKRMRAVLDHVDAEGQAIDGLPTIFGWIASEVQDRHRPEQTIVSIMDGQPSLWSARDDFQKHVPMVEVLDLLHVTPRLWDAAALFHERRSPAASKFVRERVLSILEGKVRGVIRGLRRMASTHHLSKAKRASLNKICQYFERNRRRMKYHEYLAAGFPIASGVVEGACRHVVKDRLERTGMNWIVEGAQPMLDLRCLHLCGQWNDFIQFRQRSNTQRLYPYRNSLPNAHCDLAL